MDGKYFEELEPGMKFTSVGRTITETDIVLFAGLTGDNHPLHMDDEWARKSRFGRRIAHGLLTTAISSGLVGRLGLFDGTGLAFLGTSIKYTLPVHPGDTLHVDCEVMVKKEIDGARGRIAIKLETINQEGKIVAIEERNVMIARRPAK